MHKRAGEQLAFDTDRIESNPSTAIMPTKKRKQQSEPPPPPPPDEASINSSGGGVAGLYGWWARLFGGGSASAASSAPPSTTACLAPGTLPPTFVAGFHDEEAVRSMPYRTLGRTGWAVSALSLGASSLGGVFHCVDQDEAIEVVIQGVRSGINLIDTAPWYGQGESERMLGRALKQVTDEVLFNTYLGVYPLYICCLYHSCTHCANIYTHTHIHAHRCRAKPST